MCDHTKLRAFELATEKVLSGLIRSMHSERKHND